MPAPWCPASVATRHQRPALIGPAARALGPAGGETTATTPTAAAAQAHGGRLQWGVSGSEASSASAGRAGPPPLPAQAAAKPAANPFAGYREAMAERRQRGGLLNGHHHHGQEDQGQASPLAWCRAARQKKKHQANAVIAVSGLNREVRDAFPAGAAGREVEAVTTAMPTPRWPAAGRKAPRPAPPAPREHERQLQRQGQAGF